MPEWLMKSDNYVPLKEQDTFINKSILSILNVLIKFRKQTQHKAGKFEINTALKLLSTILIILLISLSKNILFILTAGVCILLAVSLLNAEEIKHVFKLSITAALFTFIILIPSILSGNQNNSFMIVFKVLLSISTVNITSITTNWSDIIASLKLFFIPDIFIFVLDVTIKYIIIFSEFSLDMLYSLKLRSVGRNKDKNSSLSGIMGTVFIKSKEMSEEMYGAMECRGFSGEYKIKKRFKLRIQDILFIILIVMFILIYIYFDRL